MSNGFLPLSKIAKQLNQTKDRMRLHESTHTLERDSQSVFKKRNKKKGIP